MQAYWNIIRPKNLAIIGITQFILYYFLILPNVLKPSLDEFLFILLVIDTICIAAAGFVINDIFDTSMDFLNKPDKSYIPNTISLKNAKVYYVLIITIGLCISCFIAYKINDLPLITIYPLACILLFLYSYTLKNTVLIGNVIVSIFVALVSGIVWFAERNSIETTEIPKQYILVIEVLMVYVFFSFLVNFTREIVKDMEDFYGDQLAELITFPIRYGMVVTKKLCISLMIFTILVISSWILMTHVHLSLFIESYLTLFVLLPLAYIVYLLILPTTKSDFAKISNILKWVMIAGLFSIIVINVTK